MPWPNTNFSWGSLIGKDPEWMTQSNLQNTQAILGGGFGEGAGIGEQAEILAKQNAEMGLDALESQQQIASSIPGTGVENVDLPMDFDVGGMAAGIAKGLKAFGDSGPEAPKAPQGSILKPIQMAGKAQPIQQPQAQPQAIGQPSNAMQTIQQQNLGSVPNIQDVIKMRQMRGMF